MSQTAADQSVCLEVAKGSVVDEVIRRRRLKGAGFSWQVPEILSHRFGRINGNDYALVALTRSMSLFCFSNQKSSNPVRVPGKLPPLVGAVDPRDRAGFQMWGSDIFCFYAPPSRAPERWIVIA
jgi:hypothetical protein